MDELCSLLKARMMTLTTGCNQSTIAKMKSLATRMRHASLSLRFHSYTLREMILGVAYTQRAYLDALAFTDYIEHRFEDRMMGSSMSVQPPLTHVLGASSMEATTVNRLQLAGVPAYLVVTDDEALVLGATVLEPMPASVVPDLVTRDICDARDSQPAPLLYDGYPSSVMHAIMTQPSRYVALDSYFLDLDVNSMIIPMGVRGRVRVGGSTVARPKRSISASNRKGTQCILSLRAVFDFPQSGRTPCGAVPIQRDKWVEIEGDYTPPTVAGWSGALRRVDRSARLPDPAPKRFTGYRFPDPGMIIFSEARRERNIFAWLVSRSANLRRLRNALESEEAVPIGVSNEMWRVYLGTDVAESAIDTGQQGGNSVVDSFNARAPALARRQAAASIFGKPPDKFNLQEATWRGHTIRWGTVFQHDALLVQEIMWDLHITSFRFDLIALDRYLAPGRWDIHKYERLDVIAKVFGTTDALAFEDDLVEDIGIASPDAYERNRAYAAFALLMEAWPRFSFAPRLAGVGPSPEDIAFGYCSTFSRTFGRPPVLPKAAPFARTGLGIIPYPAIVDGR